MRARSRRGIALGCLATVAVADYVLKSRRPAWILVGLFDQPAHVATATLVLLNLGSRPDGWRKGFMVGSLLPDLDHVPLVLRHAGRSTDDPRPVTHCLLAAAPVGALALARRSDPLAGMAAGMLAHFLRDLGVGTGVPLLWPATARPLRVPYAVYAAGCLILARRATLRGGL